AALRAITTPTPNSPLFPYTTLFRSTTCNACRPSRSIAKRARTTERLESEDHVLVSQPASDPRRERDSRDADVRCLREPRPRRLRSEEHTSELQSRENLVCRLLLEKK